MGRERERDGSRARAHINNVQRALADRVSLPVRPRNDSFGQDFRLWTWDQNVWCDVQSQAIELLRPGEVLQGLMRGAAGDEFVEGGADFHG